MNTKKEICENKTAIAYYNKNENLKAYLISSNFIYLKDTTQLKPKYHKLKIYYSFKGLNEIQYIVLNHKKIYLNNFILIF